MRPRYDRAVHSVAILPETPLTAFLDRAELGVNSYHHQAIKALAKVNADLGRAGGLLKMLLKNEERLIGYSGEQLRQMTNNTVGEINRLQSSLALISKIILRD